MRTVSALLAQAKAAIPFPSHAQAAQLAKLDELQARLDDARLRVAALGQFKRGKSTLLNALLGAPILPMGVTPVTAIPTFIRAGEALSVRIALKDERRTVVVRGRRRGAPAARGVHFGSAKPAQPPPRRDRNDRGPFRLPRLKAMILVDTPGRRIDLHAQHHGGGVRARRMRRGALCSVGRPADHRSRNRLSRERSGNWSRGSSLF